MDHNEYLSAFEDVLDNMMETTARKNKDYANNDDAFANFNKCEELGICTTEAGILTRITDKLSRIANLLQHDAHVKDEAIEDSCLDMAVYSVILYIYLSNKGKEKHVPTAEDHWEKIDSLNSQPHQMDFNHDARNVSDFTPAEQERIEILNQIAEDMHPARGSKLSDRLKDMGLYTS